MRTRDSPRHWMPSIRGCDVGGGNESPMQRSGVLREGDQWVRQLLIGALFGCSYLFLNGFFIAEVE